MKEDSIINNRYKILSRIGAGGMGSVFLAEDLDLANQVIAIKILTTDENLDEEAFKRFRNEVVIARSLTHPSIVRTHDLGHEENGSYFITMEFVEGLTLKDLLKKKNTNLENRSPDNELLRIFLDILEGVSYAHAKGVIHRDLKPANILISKLGDVKIADFGTARSSELTESLTKTGFSVGTPDYMSPEQIKGEEPDQACDIYALGILLFEILTGKRPFVGDTPISIAYKQINEPLPKLEDFNVSASRELKLALLKSTEKDRDKRIKNAEEFLSILKTTPEIKNLLGDSSGSSTVSRTISESAWILGGDNNQDLIKKENYSRKNYKDLYRILSSVLLILIIIFTILFFLKPTTSPYEEALNSNNTNKEPYLLPAASPSEIPKPKLPAVEEKIPTPSQSQVILPTPSHSPLKPTPTREIPISSSVLIFDEQIIKPSPRIEIESSPEPEPSPEPEYSPGIEPSPEIVMNYSNYKGMIEIYDFSSLTKEPRGLTLRLNFNAQEISGFAKITGLNDLSVTGKLFERGIELNLVNKDYQFRLVGGKRENGYRGTYTTLSTGNTGNYGTSTSGSANGSGAWAANL